MNEDRRTPLHHAHLELGARLVSFAGFQMPIQYDGIIKEHHRCRQTVGLFDVSHMGEIRISGPQALSVLNGLVTNDLNRIADGRAQYTAMCAEDGTIVDDLIVYRLSAQDLLVCVNASNRATDLEFMKQHGVGDAHIADQSDAWAQIAVQGPSAPELLARVFPDQFPGLRPFRIRSVNFGGARAYVSTTGYTGEKGAEIYIHPDDAAGLWKQLMHLGQDLGIGPVGLGARDTLRLEMGYCLYGNDIDRSTTPLEAGLGWVTRLDAGDFVGRDALLAQRTEGIKRRLVGIEVLDKGIPRQGYEILHGDDTVGHITSGTRSPSTGRSIGLGYVRVDLASPGVTVQVNCRGRVKRARIVETPFYHHE